MTRRWGRLTLVLPLVLAGCLADVPSVEWEPPVVVSDGWLAMGTFFEADLRVRPRDVDSARRWLEWARFEIARLERISSRHDPESALSALNRALGADDVLHTGARVDAELEAMLFESVGVWKESGGAFDVTVGPLVDVWSNAVERGGWPDLEPLRLARRRVGAERLLLDGEGEIAVTVRGVQIDLDGISKGAVLDRLRDDLAARLPAAAALLSFGESSIVAIGAPDDRGWRLLVRSRDPARGSLGSVLLRDRALSVSSSRGSVRAIAGVRVSHVIDPRTGTPVEGTVEAIVTADRAARADAWSTALLVLGARPTALQLVEKAGVEAYVFGTAGRSAATQGWQWAGAVGRSER